MGHPGCVRRAGCCRIWAFVARRVRYKDAGLACRQPSQLLGFGPRVGGSFVADRVVDDINAVGDGLIDRGEDRRAATAGGGAHVVYDDIGVRGYSRDRRRDGQRRGNHGRLDHIAGRRAGNVRTMALVIERPRAVREIPGADQLVVAGEARLVVSRRWVADTDICAGAERVGVIEAVAAHIGEARILRVDSGVEHPDHNAFAAWFPRRLRCLPRHPAHGSNPGLSRCRFG